MGNLPFEREALIAAAREADSRGDFATAASNLQQVIAQDPLDVIARAWLGHVLVELEQHTAALETFDEALHLDPCQAGAHSGKATALAELGRDREALTAAMLAIAHGPTAARYVILSDIYDNLGRPADSLDALVKARAIDPNDEEACFNLAVMLRDHNPDEAVRLLHHAIAIDANYALAHAELGLALLRQNQLEAATAALLRATALDHTAAWPWIYLAAVQTALGDLDKAQTHLREAIRWGPLLSLPRRQLGRLLESRDDLVAAENEYRGAIAVDPRDPDAAVSLATLLERTGRTPAARAWVRRALGVDPNNRDAMALLARWQNPPTAPS